MGPGAVSYAEDVLCVKAIFFGIGNDPVAYGFCVLEGSRIFVFRRKPVGLIDHRKATFSQRHAVELVDFLVAINPAAAMDAQNDRQFAFLCLGTVDI